MCTELGADCFSSRPAVSIWNSWMKLSQTISSAKRARKLSNSVYEVSCSRFHMTWSALEESGDILNALSIADAYKGGWASGQRPHPDLSFSKPECVLCLAVPALGTSCLPYEFLPAVQPCIRRYLVAPRWSKNGKHSSFRCLFFFPKASRE